MSTLDYSMMRAAPHGYGGPQHYHPHLPLPLPPLGGQPLGGTYTQGYSHDQDADDLGQDRYQDSTTRATSGGYTSPTTTEAFTSPIITSGDYANSPITTSHFPSITSPTAFSSTIISSADNPEDLKPVASFKTKSSYDEQEPYNHSRNAYHQYDHPHYIPPPPHNPFSLPPYPMDPHFAQHHAGPHEFHQPLPYSNPQVPQSPGSGNPRVLIKKEKPQCWEHGCNGRTFSTFSNLLRHQREKSGTAAKAQCPKCHAEFTRTTARNGHMSHDKCKPRARKPSDEPVNE